MHKSAMCSHTSRVFCSHTSNVPTLSNPPTQMRTHVRYARLCDGDAVDTIYEQVLVVGVSNKSNACFCVCVLMVWCDSQVFVVVWMCECVRVYIRYDTIHASVYLCECVFFLFFSALFKFFYSFMLNLWIECMLFCTIQA